MGKANKNYSEIMEPQDLIGDIIDRCVERVNLGSPEQRNRVLDEIWSATWNDIRSPIHRGIVEATCAYQNLQ